MSSVKTMRNYSKLLFRRNEKFDIPSQLLLQSHFGLIIVTFIGALFNYLLNFSNELVIVMFCTTFLYALGYYILSRQGNFIVSLIIFLITSLFIINFLWFKNGGINGGTLLIIFAFYIFLQFLSNNKYAIYIAILYVLNTAILFFIEFTYPDIIVGYDTQTHRYIDIIIVSYFIFFLGSPMLLFGKRLFKTAKTKAEESERSKMDFLANISHDVRTPLNAIIGFSELLNSEGINEADRKVFTHTIKTNSENLLHMVNNILNLSQIDSGLLKVEKSKFNLNSFMNMIFQTYNPLMVSDSVKLIMKNQISKENIEINSDQNLIYQVLTNLLNNSLKFTKEGEIIFGVKMENEIVFYVKDSGPGIPKEMQSIIFNRFKQVKRDNESQNKGVGLGLAICNDIVKLLGGKILLESDEINGTTISFTIPI